MFHPLFGQHSHLGQRFKRVGVEHFLTIAPVETFGKAVLNRLAELDVLDFDMLVLASQLEIDEVNSGPLSTLIFHILKFKVRVMTT
nr:hypothetical protein [Allomuricauda onchidii]